MNGNGNSPPVGVAEPHVATFGPNDREAGALQGG